jgi:hypothetical protein
VFTSPGDDRLSPAKDYHGPRMLNGRVREGNGCGHPGMLTGIRCCINRQRKSDLVNRHGLGRPEGRINAAKRSAVSTGQLRRLPALHTQPIDLVVFQEPSALRQGDLVLRGVSRLDAFSVYPGRT